MATASIAPAAIAAAGFTGNDLFLNVYVSVVENGQTRVGSPARLAFNSISNIAQQDTSFTDLKAGTRYTAVISLGSDFSENVLARFCFKTEPDLSRPLGHYGDINHSGQAGGCYAFADLSGPSNRRKVQACLCGARNSSGQWARTDSGDGYSYIMDAGWRQSVGCTTN